MRMIQDAAVDKDASLESEELAFKNRLIKYFSYPYSGDIGPSGTDPQGYDGPDLYHYAWMDTEEFGVDEMENTVTAELEVKSLPLLGSVFVPFMPASSTEDTVTLTFELSPNGLVVKPKSVTGKRLAQGRIQDALASFIVAYAAFQDSIGGAILSAKNMLVVQEAGQDWKNIALGTFTALEELVNDRLRRLMRLARHGVRLTIRSARSCLHTATSWLRRRPSRPSSRRPSA